MVYWTLNKKLKFKVCVCLQARIVLVALVLLSIALNQFWLWMTGVMSDYMFQERCTNLPQYMFFIQVR
jgi:hypothetical protein